MGNHHLLALSWSRKNEAGDLGEQRSGDTDGKSVAFQLP